MQTEISKSMSAWVLNIASFLPRPLVERGRTADGFPYPARDVVGSSVSPWQRTLWRVVIALSVRNVVPLLTLNFRISWALYK